MLQQQKHHFEGFKGIGYIHILSGRVLLYRGAWKLQKKPAIASANTTLQKCAIKHQKGQCRMSLRMYKNKYLQKSSYKFKLKHHKYGPLKI